MEPLVLDFKDFKTLSDNHRIYYYESVIYFDFHFLADGRIIKSRVFKKDIENYERFFSDIMFYGAIRILFNIRLPKVNLISEIQEGTIIPIDIKKLQDDELKNKDIQKEGVK